MKFPALPQDLVDDVVAFFGEVHARYNGEAIALLFLEPKTGRYQALIPPQRIPGYRDYRGKLRAYLSLDYGTVPRPANFLHFGTLHSHADLSAYSSGVDCDDERFGDGLHIVFGHFGSAVLSRCAAFVANGRRFQVEAERVLPSTPPPKRSARPEWMAQVRFEEVQGWPRTRSSAWNGDADGAGRLLVTESGSSEA